LTELHPGSIGQRGLAINGKLGENSCIRTVTKFRKT